MWKIHKMTWKGILPAFVLLLILAAYWLSCLVPEGPPLQEGTRPTAKEAAALAEKYGLQPPPKKRDAGQTHWDFGISFDFSIPYDFGPLDWLVRQTVQKTH